MQGYTVKEAATVLGVPRKRVWELIARGVLAGSSEAGGAMRVFLGAGPMPAAPHSPPPEAPPPRTNGNGGAEGGRAELSPFRELLTEFRSLTERYGQALLALGEARGEVASLRSRVDLLEARMDLRLPGPSAQAPVAWTSTPIPPSTEQRLEPVVPAPDAAAASLAAEVDLPPLPVEPPTADVVAVAKRRRTERAKPKAPSRRPVTRAKTDTATSPPRRARSARPGAAGIAAALARAADPSKGLTDADESKAVAAPEAIAEPVAEVAAPAAPAAPAPVVFDDDEVLPGAAAAAEQVDHGDAEPPVAGVPVIDVPPAAEPVNGAEAELSDTVEPVVDLPVTDVHADAPGVGTVEPAIEPDVAEVDDATGEATAPPVEAAETEPDVEAVEAVAASIEAAETEPEAEAVEGVATSVEAAETEPEAEAVEGVAASVATPFLEEPPIPPAGEVAAASESVDEPVTAEGAEREGPWGPPDAGMISAGIEAPVVDSQQAALLDTPEATDEPAAASPDYGPHYSTVIEEPDWFSEADLDAAVPASVEPPVDATRDAPAPEAPAPEAPPPAQAVVAAPPDEPTTHVTDVAPFPAEAAGFLDLEPEPPPEPLLPPSSLTAQPPPTVETPAHRDVAPAPTPMTEYPEEETILWLGVQPEEPASEEYAAEMEVATPGWHASGGEDAAPEPAPGGPPQPDARADGAVLPDDVDPDEMELGAYQPTPEGGPPTAPAAERPAMPGGRELDEALAQLDAIAHGEPEATSPPPEPAPPEPVAEAGDEESNPAARAIDRLRRLFPG